MVDGFFAAATASMAAAAVTTTGILTIRHYREWAENNTVMFIAYAAGVLVSVSFLHIVPQSTAMNSNAPTYTLGGYLAMVTFNRFITAHVCDKPETSKYALGLVPMVGIGLHSFIDGIVYSVGFSVSAYTGVLVAIGMVLHEFPEGIVTYALLLKSGFSDRTSFRLSIIAAAITTPLGTLATHGFISAFDRPALGLLLAFSAGTLIYVGATHLLPRAESEAGRYSVIALVSGVAIAFGIIFSKG